MLLLCGALGAALLGACASTPPGAAERPPVVFVHGNGDNAGLWITTMWRFESNGWPRGYFGVPRDQISLDGKSPPAGIPPGTPGLSAAKVKLSGAPGRAVAGEFNGERIVGRAWPAVNNEVVFLELQY